MLRTRLLAGLLLALPIVALGAALDSIDVQTSKGRYLLAGEIRIDASMSAVYRVITDYDRLSELDSGIAESRVVERPADGVALVYTRLTGCVLFFCRDVERIERVEEISATEIFAEVVPDDDGDVAFEQSRWRLSEDGGQTRVLYETEIDLDFFVPPLLGPPMVRRVLRNRVAATLLNLEDAALNR